MTKELLKASAKLIAYLYGYQSEYAKTFCSSNMLEDIKGMHDVLTEIHRDLEDDSTFKYLFTDVTIKDGVTRVVINVGDDCKHCLVVEYNGDIDMRYFTRYIDEPSWFNSWLGIRLNRKDKTKGIEYRNKYLSSYPLEPDSRELFRLTENYLLLLKGFIEDYVKTHPDVCVSE